jgi:hypothetical protein
MSDDNGKLKVTFAAFDKMIEGVPNKDVAKDECDGRTLEFHYEIVSVNELVQGHIRVCIGTTIYFTREVKIEATRCTHHPLWLKFEGSLGAPGHGQSYACACGEAMWSPWGRENAVPFKGLDESEFIYSEDEVR